MRKLYLTFLSVFLIVGTAGCTTYTWPDGSKETVLGVPAEKENARYEDERNKAVRYRVPGKPDDKQKRAASEDSRAP
ncbi:hypothetical protein [Halomonas piscis]|uniref:hypothetical protein n=1 Tax=Halomonas piscis TaxID=3031727 RepID=UPI002893253F|nr:hypothetical protein [Halomonas piscis]